MKTHKHNTHQNKHTLEDYLHAARNDKPVIAFEESARRLLEADRRKRRGFWWFTRAAFAMPLALLHNARNTAQTLTQTTIQTLAQTTGQLLAPPISARPWMKGAAAGAAATLFLTLLIGRPEEISSPTVASSTVALHQAPSNRASSTKQPSTKQPKSPQLAFATNRTETSSRAGSLHVASQNNSSRNDVSQSALSQNGSSQNSSFLENAAATAQRVSVVADSAEQQPQATQQTTTQTLPPQQTLPTLAAWAQQPYQSTTASTNAAMSVVVIARTNVSAVFAETPKNTDEQPLLPSPDHIGRFAVEYRVAARTGFDNTSGGTPLQNMALGVLYRMDEHHSVGVEGGTQPFATGYRSVLTTVSVAANNDTQLIVPDSQERGLITLTTPNPPDKNSFAGNNAQNRTSEEFTTIGSQAQSALLPWFAAAYQYNHDAFDVLGVDVQPVARVSVGGGAAGGLGRLMAGVQFVPVGNMTFLLAAEAAGLARTLTTATFQQRFTVSPQTGMTVGVSVKF